MRTRVRVVGLVLATLMANGRAVDVTAEGDYFADLPVVLSVSRLSQPLADSPAAVTVIDRQTIRASGAREVADLFRLIPGFVSALAPQSGASVAYHGLTETEPRRMQVLIDGRSQYSAIESGGVQWNLIQVALDDIERIEVVRGTNAATYGSNAFLGVANIITRRGSQIPRLTAQAWEGQGGIRDRMARIAGSGNRWEYRLTAFDSQDEGIDVDTGHLERGAFRDDRERSLTDFRFDALPTDADELSLRLGRSRSTVQLGFADLIDNPVRDKHTVQTYGQVDWRRTLGPTSDLALRYYRVSEDIDERLFVDLTRLGVTPALGIGTVVDADLGARVDRDDLEMSHTISPGHGWRLVWGGNYRHDRVRAPHFFNGQPLLKERLFRLFGNLEWRASERWIANLGATREDSSVDAPRFSPRLMVNFHINNAVTLRAGASRAYRSPSILEKFREVNFFSDAGVAIERSQIPNPGLRSESLVAREFGAFVRSPRLRTEFDARLFHELVRDRMRQYPVELGPDECEVTSLLTFGRCGETDRVFNTERIRIFGFEHRIDARPFAKTRVTVSQSFIRLRVNAIVPTDAPGKIDQFNAFFNQSRQSAPRHATSILLMQELPAGVELSVAYYSVGAMKWTENTRARYNRLDWRVAQRFRVGPTQVEWSFAVQGEGADRGEYASNLILGTRGIASLRVEL